MVHRRHDRPECCTVTVQLVGNQAKRNPPLTSQEFAKEALRCTTVASRLDEDVDHVAVLIDGTPQIVPVAGELLIRPSKRAFWRNGSASLISRIAAIHSDRDARWRPGRRSLPLHRSCRGDREPFGWDRACSWNRTEVRNRRFPSCSAVGRGSIGR